MTYTAPATAAVYGNDLPGRGNPLKRLESALHPGIPVGWDSLVFVHSRRSPGQAERLVAITVMDDSSTRYATNDRHLLLLWYSIQPGSLFSPPDIRISYNVAMYMQIHTGSRFHLFAGQPDRSDASHFTIGYEIDGLKGTIDGYMRNTDSVKLQVRDGPPF
jgi:hypothetical protein